MRKKWLQSALAIVLAVTMCLGLAPLDGLGGVFKAAEDTILQDTEFDGDFWNDGIWSFVPDNDDWSGSQDSKPDWTDETNKVFSFWNGGSSTATVTQNVSSLPAGIYTLSVVARGDNAKVKLKIGTQESEEYEVNSGFESDSWETHSSKFEVTEGLTDVAIGFILIVDNGTVEIDSISIEKEEAEEPVEGYSVTVTPSKTTVEVGETVTLEATVKEDGETIENLEDAGLKLWWWPDKWQTGHEDGLVEESDVTITKDSDGYSFSAEVTPLSVGTYYIAAQLELDGTEKAVTFATITATEPEVPEVDTSIESDINVAKIKDLPEDFIMGMDISSVISEFNSGVTYKDYNGNTINNVTDFCKFLAANGITHIRIRVWNDPYDSNGNGYGGGNNDVKTAKLITDGCRAAGLKVLIDFHCSDFWADPGKQQVPKAWEGYTLEQKKEAVNKFIKESLETIDPQKGTVAMVQVGNETTGAFVGESGAEKMCVLFQAGSDAVKAYNPDVKVVIHVTNPEKNNVTTWAKNLDDNKVDYDIIATSYYPYWHGTLANLKSEFEKVKSTYGKDVMVAETSYAYTLKDSDGWDNTARVGNNDTGENTIQPFTVQGQATAIRNLMDTVNNAGGLGVFYWEPAWITVGDTTGLSGYDYADQVAENKAKWEKYGSGWAASYASGYDPDDAGKWYGGSAVDNEAFFYPDGTPNAALHVWKYVQSGAKSKYTSVDKIIPATETITAGGEYSLPKTIEVTYGGKVEDTVEESVKWNNEDVKAIDVNVPGTYVVNGTVTFSKEIDQGSYAGAKTAEVTYTLTVKLANFIDAEDAGFEKGDNFTPDGNGLKKIPSNEDVYAGQGCLHWYSATADINSVTYNIPITLEAGKYTFEAIAGGFDGDSVKLQILDTKDKLLFEGDATTLTGWGQWKPVITNFSLEEKTDVKLRVVINIQKGGWGSVDSLYLHEYIEASEDPENPSEDTSKPIIDVQPTDSESDVPKVSLGTMTNDELKDAGIFSQENLESGELLQVVLRVSAIDSIDEEEEAWIWDELLAEGYEQVGQYLDLDLYKWVGSYCEKLEELDGKIKVTITIPEDLRDVDSNINRTFAIVRIHDGVATLIEGLSYDPETGEFTFETDAFSTYAIVYKDEVITPAPTPDPENPKNPTPSDTPDTTKPTDGTDTGDHSPIIPFAVLLVAAAGMVCVVAVRRRKVK